VSVLAALWVRAAVSEAPSSSSSASTVTVWAVFQPVVVKVSVREDTVTSVLSLSRVTVTSAEGSVASFTS